MGRGGRGRGYLRGREHRQNGKHTIQILFITEKRKEETMWNYSF